MSQTEARLEGWARSRESRVTRLREFNLCRSEAVRLPIGSRIGICCVTGYGRGRAPGLYYQIKCDCGTEKTVNAQNFKRTKSCGCLTKALISKSRRVHGETDSPAWNSWKSMIERCEWRGHKSWKDYGGRGISVCASWHRYENFRSDMGQRPDGSQLDRVDNSKGYEPSNCRWSTPRQNANNRRSSVFLELGNERLTVSQWARRLNILNCTLSGRIRAGWSVEKTLSTPVEVQRNNAFPLAGG